VGLAPGMKIFYLYSPVKLEMKSLVEYFGLLPDSPALETNPRHWQIVQQVVERPLRGTTP
jgi:hypothetical protein